MRFKNSASPHTESWRVTCVGRGGGGGERERERERERENSEERKLSM